MAAKIVSRISTPSAGPDGLQPTTVKILVGDVPEIAEQRGSIVQAYHELPNGALLKRPADYCIGKVYRTQTVERYYVADGNWYEKRAGVWIHVCESADQVFSSGDTE